MIAGIELGGTKCVCVLASGPGDVREQVRIATTSPDVTLGAIHDVLARWKSSHGFEAMGIGSFGPLDLDPASATYGAIVNTPKPGWSGTNLLTLVEGYGVPVAIDTDVNGAALAEGRWGAGRGLDSFAYVTVGTGIGVGSVVLGRTIRGLGHCEAGHMRVPRLRGRDDWAGHCPFHGDCVEGLAAGPAIQARAGISAESLASSHPVWDEVVHALAGLFHNLVLTTAPQRILLGGGVGGGQAFLLPRLRTSLLDSLSGYAVAPMIAAMGEAFLTSPQLGDNAGPMGAIALGLNARDCDA